MHAGVDLAAPAGTNVQAMAAGSISVGRSGDVTVKHSDGSSTTYRHVVPSVKEGDQVAAGQVIAQLRAHDPRSTGPHLHFEARNAKGNLIDPKTLLGPKATAPKATPEAGAIPGKSAQWWRGSPAVGAYASQVARAQHSIMTSMADNRQTNTSTTSNSTTINGGIQVQTSATDASGIARDMEQALNRRSFAYRNQSGMA
ncbi:M23 family metallopeptidase [Methylobacterium currus]|nr:M23 family metallopeptidase [Methylobacterium currus]